MFSSCLGSRFLWHVPRQTPSQTVWPGKAWAGQRCATPCSKRHQLCVFQLFQYSTIFVQLLASCAMGKGAAKVTPTSRSFQRIQWNMGCASVRAKSQGQAVKPALKRPAGCHQGGATKDTFAMFAVICVAGGRIMIIRCLHVFGFVLYAPVSQTVQWHLAASPIVTYQCVCRRMFVAV